MLTLQVTDGGSQGPPTLTARFKGAVAEIMIGKAQVAVTPHTNAMGLLAIAHGSDNKAMQHLLARWRAEGATTSYDLQVLYPDWSSDPLETVVTVNKDHLNASATEIGCAYNIRLDAEGALMLVDDSGRVVATWDKACMFGQPREVITQLYKFVSMSPAELQKHLQFLYDTENALMIGEK